MILRPGTSDKDVFIANYEQNEYRLPSDMQGQVVIDIGAHIGAFTYTVLERGPRGVTSIEPDPENAEIAFSNLNQFNNVLFLKAACWGNFSPGQLYLSDYPMIGVTINTGGARLTEIGNRPVLLVSFDWIVDLACFSFNTDLIDLCKMDCEGSEWPILFTSKKIKQVKRFCGEFHEDRKLGHPINGKDRFNIEDMEKFFVGQGYEFSFERHGNAGEGLGLFWAEIT